MRKFSKRNRQGTYRNVLGDSKYVQNIEPLASVAKNALCASTSTCGLSHVTTIYTYVHSHMICMGKTQLSLSRVSNHWFLPKRKQNMQTKPGWTLVRDGSGTRIITSLKGALTVRWTLAVLSLTRWSCSGSSRCCLLTTWDRELCTVSRTWSLATSLRRASRGEAGGGKLQLRWVGKSKQSVF